MTNVESDFQPNASRTWSFESDLEGWVVTSGTFNRQPGGAQGTGFHLSSSECLDEQCDIVRSPMVRMQSELDSCRCSTATTPRPRSPFPMTGPTWAWWTWTRGTRTTVSPDGGKLYDLPRAPPNGACVTANQAGWSADTDPDCNAPAAFHQSTWSAAALNPGGMFTGRKAHLEVAYGTDPLVIGFGFDFDQVTLTNFDLQIPDVQVCTVKPVIRRKR